MSMLECTAVDIRLKVYAHYAPTRRGSQFAQSAQERMMSRKPTASTKESRMTAAEMVISPRSVRVRDTHS